MPLYNQISIRKLTLRKYTDLILRALIIEVVYVKRNRLANYFDILGMKLDLFL